MTKDYLHRASIGQDAECRRIIDWLEPRFDEYYDAEAIDGYWLAFVGNELDATEKMIPADTLEITAGRFPFLYLRLNYLEGHPDNDAIAEIVTGAGFVPF